MAKRVVSQAVDGVVRKDILSKNKEYYQGSAEAVAEVEEITKPGLVVSRLDHPVTLTYDGAGMIIPPRGKELIANINKLGRLPGGVSLIIKG